MTKETGGVKGGKDSKEITEVKGEASKTEDPKHPVKGEEAARDPSKVKEPLPGYARPVVIHRAIYGSFERFIAILTEHFAGRWPFWLSPRQVLIVPVMPAVNDYAESVKAQLRAVGIHADTDLSGNTLQKKVRNAQIAMYNFTVVVGAEEEKGQSVNIRNRDDQASQQRGEVIPLAEAIEKMVKLRDERRLENKL